MQEFQIDVRDFGVYSCRMPHQLNPLLPNGNYSYRIIKNFVFKKRRDQEKNFL